MADQQHGKKPEDFSDRPASVSEEEKGEIEAHHRLRAPVIHEVVRDQGEEELARPPASLWWSGVTAGVVMSTSTGAKGALHHYLPDAPWTHLVEAVGYSLGFVLVILGRLQLFTENTLTAVLPLMSRWSGHVLFLTARLWAIVLAGNLVGTLLFALAAVYIGLFPQDQLDSFLAVARSAMDKSALEMGLLAIPAGFLVAVLVWVLPSAEGQEFLAIMVVAYFIGAGDFTHVVVGAADALLLVCHGEMGVGHFFGVFLLPTLAGNILGGTGLFAVLARSQVRKEL